MRIIGIAVLSALLASTPAVASEPPLPSAERLRSVVPEVSVVDQNGRRLNFYADLVRGHTVAINLVFTHCESVCPAQGRQFASLRKVIPKDVRLISISLDPERDTPARLRKWQSGFGKVPGWTLVTGKKAEIDRLVSALTGDVSRPAMHTPLVFIGNDSNGSWVRANGLGGTDAIKRQLEEAAHPPKDPARPPELQSN